ncbi:MAG: ABC transporter substrate-binding protein [Sphingobium sp.]
MILAILGAVLWLAMADRDKGPASASAQRHAGDFPVTVRSCGHASTFAKAPTRAIVGSANMVQTILDLGLIDHFAGVSALRWTFPHLDAAPEVLKKVRDKEFTRDKPGMEGVIGQRPDFYFSGWQYGFSEVTGVTPANLERYGIGSYTLDESCIRIGARPAISMESTYRDIRALGQVFGVRARAEEIIGRQQAILAAIQSRIGTDTPRPRMMFCSGCISDSAPRTSGGEGFPQVVIDGAGGTNIFQDIHDSYVNVSWEAVIERNPQWIIIDPSGRAEQDVVAYLTGAPALRGVEAIRKRQFIFLTYPEFEPSTRNAEAIERIAGIIHPVRAP